MGLRDKLKQKVRRVADRLSGEYSAQAPTAEEIVPYERNVDNDGVEVVRARLVRPVDSKSKKNSS